MRFKHAFACARPVEFSESIQPIIPTPGHGSFPSGHATEAFMMVRLLTALLPDGVAKYEKMLNRIAARTSINRTVAGVHFPVDTLAGQHLGHALAEYILCLADRPSPADSSTTPGRWLQVDLDIERTKTIPVPGAYDFPQTPGPVTGSAVADPEPGRPVDAVHWFWQRAKGEWSA